MTTLKRWRGLFSDSTLQTLALVERSTMVAPLIPDDPGPRTMSSPSNRCGVSSTAEKDTPMQTLKPPSMNWLAFVIVFLYLVLLLSALAGAYIVTGLFASP